MAQRNMYFALQTLPFFGTQDFPVVFGCQLTFRFQGTKSNFFVESPQAHKRDEQRLCVWSTSECNFMVKH